jgi:hypothetical protein
MAKTKIPGPLERRHLIERDLSVAQSQRIADAYLEEGREIEAIDFLRKAQAKEALGELRRQALARGDAFLLRSVTVALDCEPERDEWRTVAEAASSTGRDRYATEARRQADRGKD